MPSSKQETISRIDAKPRFFWRAALLAFLFAAVMRVLFAGLIRCPLARLAHVPCPMCGSVRTVHAVFDENWRGVWTGNPPALLVVVVIGLLGVRALYVMYRDGDLRQLTNGHSGFALMVALSSLMVIEVALWVARFFGCFGGPLRLI